MSPFNLAFAFALALCASLGVAISATIRPQKPTDDSVCDLAPNTVEALARRALVPARLPLDVQSAAYGRIAAQFVVRACGQGQVLILHTRDGDQLDSRLLPELAGSLCSAADVARRETVERSSLTGEELKGFELRCKITKLARFKSDFEEKEALESTEAYLKKLR